MNYIHVNQIFLIKLMKKCKKRQWRVLYEVKINYRKIKKCTIIFTCVFSSSFFAILLIKDILLIASENSISLIEAVILEVAFIFILFLYILSIFIMRDVILANRKSEV